MTRFIMAFLIGGAICVVGQIILLKTSITPARILVIFVVAGVVLTVLGLYEPLVNLAGGGATVPLTGFGYALAEGVKKEVAENGIWGIFTGGVKATAAGITAAVVFGYFASVLSNPKAKK
jgi:stage V sporulation protein AE